MQRLLKRGVDMLRFIQRFLGLVGLLAVLLLAAGFIEGTVSFGAALCLLPVCIVATGRLLAKAVQPVRKAPRRAAGNASGTGQAGVGPVPCRKVVLAKPPFGGHVA